METEIDPRLRFYFENKSLIDEWADLPRLERARADEFFRDLGNLLDSGLSDFRGEPDLKSETDVKWKKHHVLLRDWLDPDSERPAISVAIEWTERAGFWGAYLGVWLNKSINVYTDLYAQLKRELGADDFASNDASWITKEEVEPGSEFWSDLRGLAEKIVGSIQDHWDERVPALERAYNAVSGSQNRER